MYPTLTRNAGPKYGNSVRGREKRIGRGQGSGPGCEARVVEDIGDRQMLAYPAGCRLGQRPAVRTENLLAPGSVGDTGQRRCLAAADRGPWTEVHGPLTYNPCAGAPASSASAAG